MGFQVMVDGGNATSADASITAYLSDTGGTAAAAVDYVSSFLLGGM